MERLNTEINSEACNLTLLPSISPPSFPSSSKPYPPHLLLKKGKKKLKKQKKKKWSNRSRWKYSKVTKSDFCFHGRSRSLAKSTANDTRTREVAFYSHPLFSLSAFVFISINIITAIAFHCITHSFVLKVLTLVEEKTRQEEGAQLPSFSCVFLFVAFFVLS